MMLGFLLVFLIHFFIKIDRQILCFFNMIKLSLFQICVSLKGNRVLFASPLHHGISDCIFLPSLSTYFCYCLRCGDKLYVKYLKLILEQTHILRRLDRTSCLNLLILSPCIIKSRQKKLLEKLQVSLFRKLKLYCDQSDDNLIKDLKKKIGRDTALILEN
ncbi:uncharacterized protein B0P05DRAFT_270764 [Gilbertella persicaria]|uniref:uncharacterized protein n=1 Tax=Gilbertella persicaria TaxID=101096 RepID=UPI00221E6489|nr:uncharacterized protein B0P05DRAFT_270764 [Gilbertella persicaria]KAI8059367.1 hypothetical protein B0P05DRAFT_270764 [Gilbertella persicaria]